MTPTGGQVRPFEQSFPVGQMIEKSPQSSVPAPDAGDKEFNWRPVLFDCSILGMSEELRESNGGRIIMGRARLDAGPASDRHYVSAAEARRMHTHTLRTRFTFGDRVRFDSKLQQLAGEGTIFGITFVADGQIDYLIEIGRDGYSALQPGILEGEITLLEAACGPR